MPLDQPRQHYYDLFIDEVEHLTQQSKSKFMPKVSVRGGLTGELVRAKKQYGATSTNKDRRGRGLDTPQNDVPRESVWYGNHVNDWGHLVEDDDELRMLGSSNNDLIKAARKAFKRDADDLILDAFFADVLKGDKDAKRTVSFPAGNVIAVDVGAGADTGMNVKKLLAIRTKFQSVAFDVDLDEEDLIIGITPEMEEELFDDQRFTSTEYTKGTGGRARGDRASEHCFPEHRSARPGWPVL